MSKLVWNVYCKNYGNGDRITTYNIFDNIGFVEDLETVNGKYGGSFEDFSKGVERELLYHFWSKCEWEVIISPFPSFITKDVFNKMKEVEQPYRYLADIEDSIKVDVYSQVKMNFDIFVKYLWDNRDSLNVRH